MPGILSWAEQCYSVKEKNEQILDKEERTQNVHRKFEYEEKKSFQSHQNSGRKRLEALEGAFRYLFENSSLKLGYLQKRLIDVIIVAFMRKMFGDDLVPNLAYITKKYAIEELNDTVAILFPRRSGKTVASAIMIAVICVSQPHGNSIMYNLTALQAEEFLAEAMYAIQLHTHSLTHSHTYTLENISMYSRIPLNLDGLKRSAMCVK